MKITINKKQLNSYDMDSLKPQITVYQEYFGEPAGQEHYRLLRFLSTQFPKGKIVEIGTHAGTSAVAMNADTTAHIVTYDIVEEKHRDMADLENVTFRICDFSTDAGYRDFILSADMIFIDAPHDGIFERFCYNWLKENNYSGLTIWDDIHLNDEMRSFWNDVDLPKQDISEVGHITGTGAIFFNTDIQLAIK
jgi:predicted O-methyltransferase YrrM